MRAHGRRRPIAQLRSDIESRVRNIEGTAGSVANGNLAAIGALLSNVESDTVVETHIVNETNCATFYPSTLGSRSSRPARVESSSGSPSEAARETRTR